MAYLNQCTAKALHLLMMLIAGPLVIMFTCIWLCDIVLQFIDTSLAISHLFVSHVVEEKEAMNDEMTHHGAMDKT